MMKCEDFRLLAGADPGHLTWGQRFHRLMCRTCARYLGSMRDLDHQVEQVMKYGDLPPSRSGQSEANAPVAARD